MVGIHTIPHNKRAKVGQAITPLRGHHISALLILLSLFIKDVLLTSGVKGYQLTGLGWRAALVPAFISPQKDFYHA